MIRFRSVLVLSLLFYSQTFAQAKDEWLKQNELIQLLDGNSAQQYNVLTGRTSYMYFKSDHELYGENQDGKPSYLGKWYIDNEGQICSKYRKLFCSEISFDGNVYKFWSYDNGKFINYATAKIHKGDKASLIARYTERERQDNGLPSFVFTGPDGKPLPGQRQLEGKEAEDAIKKGLGQVLEMGREDANYAIACRESGGYSVGRSCYKKY